MWSEQEKRRLMLVGERIVAFTPGIRLLEPEEALPCIVHPVEDGNEPVRIREADVSTT